ncbi:hypothetical protein L7F22_022611 [Adiantum nelumboides]|nr:hypothetical protein [Adiantum nelumboides]
MSSAIAQLHGTDSTMESTGGAHDALTDSAADEPKQDQSNMGEQDESSAASDTKTNPRSPGRSHPTIKSNHMHINVARCANFDHYDYSIAQQGAAAQGKCKGNNVLQLHNRKGNASKPLKKLLQTSKHSTSIHSVFAFPFSCISIPASAPRHHLPFEHSDLNNDDEELIITDDAMKNGARMLHTSIIGIPHAHSSSNLTSMLPSAPVPCADHELPFTSSPVDDRAGERFAPCDAEDIIELQPAAEARSIASCSNSITRASPHRIADTDTASANPIIRKKATILGLTQPRIVPLPLPLAAQHGQYWCSRSKEQDVKHEQHLPEMLALAQERPTALTYRNIGTLDGGALEKLQQACTGVNYNTSQYRSVACADSDAGTASCCVSSLDMDSTSAGCSELVQEDHGFYVFNDAANVCAAAAGANLSSSCYTTSSWWSVLDVDLQVPEFQLLPDADHDQCCWPLADMFDP